MAQLGWIDFSPTHRDKVAAALDLLRPEGMVDELGLGTIRDGIANQLFPGISTIQTRAKYFFIIPYILSDFQQQWHGGVIKGKSPSKYLEQREYEIMWQLAAHYNYQDNFGVIGITKRKPQKIMRRPSVIYWNGLNLYRFIGSNGLSSEVFLQKAIKGEYESLLSMLSDHDDSKDHIDAEYDNIFKIKFFPAQKWSDNLTLDLNHDEAAFFRDRILTEAKGKLLKINLDEIDFIEGMKNYVAIHRSGQKTMVYTSMKEIEERLPKKQFIRVHKSFIIPISRITGIEGNIVRLKNVSSEILIGENYKAALMEIVKGKMIQ